MRSMGRSAGVMPVVADCAAMTPAACPMAIHDAWTRYAELASRSPETQRPAAMKFVLPAGSIAPRGIVGTVPSWSGRMSTPSPSERWTSIG